MIIRNRGEIEGEKMPRLIGLEGRLCGRAPVSLYQSLLVDLPDLIFEHVVSGVSIISKNQVFYKSSI